MPITPVYRVRCSGCRGWLSLPDACEPGDTVPFEDLTVRPTAAHAGMWPTSKAARRAAHWAGWSGDHCPDCVKNLTRPAPIQGSGYTPAQLLGGDTQ